MSRRSGHGLPARTRSGPPSPGHQDAPPTGGASVCLLCGAEAGIRTPTGVLPLRPERSASASSATSASQQSIARPIPAPPSRSADPRELLERVAALGGVAPANQERIRHLAHVHRALAVHRQAVRCPDAAGAAGVAVQLLQAAQQLAVLIVHADTGRLALRRLAVPERALAGHPLELADVDHAVTARVD